MSKPVLGLVCEPALGLLGSVCAFLGLVTGALAGVFARRVRSMPLGILFALLLSLSSASVLATRKVAPENPWAPLRFMVGEWEGDSEGQPGKGSVKRTYRFVLAEKFLYEQNVSTYPPQPKNEKGEVHEHWALFSFDRTRRLLVLRQFHQEGFVNQYSLAAGSSPGKLVFESEALENVPATRRARETYDLVSPDEFVETFDLAVGGGAFEVYSRTRFRRASLTSRISTPVIPKRINAVRDSRTRPVPLRPRC